MKTVVYYGVSHEFPTPYHVTSLGDYTTKEEVLEDLLRYISATHKGISRFVVNPKSQEEEQYWQRIGIMFNAEVKVVRR